MGREVGTLKTHQCKKILCYCSETHLNGGKGGGGISSAKNNNQNQKLFFIRIPQ